MWWKDETRDHLYFVCPYTYTVWLRIAGGVLGNSITPDGNGTMTGLQGNTFSAMDYVLIRLAFQVTVYLIWRERNACRYQTSWIGTGQMCWQIDWTIRNRILALKYGATHKFEGLLRRWFAIYDWTGQWWHGSFIWSFTLCCYIANFLTLWKWPYSFILLINLIFYQKKKR